MTTRAEALARYREQVTEAAQQRRDRVMRERADEQARRAVRLRAIELELPATDGPANLGTSEPSVTCPDPPAAGRPLEPSP